MQIETMMRHYYTSIIRTVSSAREDAEQLELSYVANGNAKWYSYSGK